MRLSSGTSFFAGGTLARFARARALAGLVGLAVVSTVATLASPAQAEETTAQLMGRTLFNEGVVLFNEGKFAEACAKLEASLRAYPGIGTRGKLAECYEKAGRFVSAWTAYREVAQLAAKSGDFKREQVALERVKAVEPKLSYLTIILPPANAAPALTVKRNGIEIDQGRFGTADALDAGTFELDVSAPGRKPFHTQVVINAGDQARFEVPRLEEYPPAPAPSTPHQVSDARGETWHWQRTAGIAAGAAGVVAVGVGAALGLSANGTYDDAFAGGGCDKATLSCDRAGQDAVDDARSRATVSTIAVLGGIALAAGGAVLYFTAPKHGSNLGERRERHELGVSTRQTGGTSASRSWQIGGTPLPSGGAFFLGGTL